MRLKSTLLLLFVLFCMAKAFAQPCTTLGQTPSTAFPVCGTSAFNQNNVPICGGTGIPTTCTGGTYADVNPFWYTFTCFTSGTLGFIIKPNSAVDDYDWALFDITGRNPNDIFTVPSLNIAENWSAFTGNTGAAANTNGLRNCAGNFPNFNSMSTITAGREYLLLVSNWSASQQGYSLTFSGGTAVITDPLQPLIQSASASCDGTQVVVRFNKKVKCNSIASNGSDFTIAGGTIVSAVGIGCNTSFDLDSVLITLAAPLAANNYNVVAATGTDGNTVLDNCGTGVTVGSSLPFTVNAQSSIPMGTITAPPCAPVTITLTFSEPVFCNTVAADGSDFLITGPSAVTVVSATTVNCVSGMTNTVTLQLNAPVVTTGTYQVIAATGTDGNTLRGQCNREVLVNSNTTFTLAPQPALVMPTVTAGSCVPTTLNLVFPQPINCNSVAADGSDFIISGPAAVTIISATATNCNAAGETTTITVQLSAPMLVSGSYNLSAVTGSDGNSITASCGRQITAPANTAQFILPAQTPVAMATITAPPCVPVAITLSFAELINCNSVAANGSDFLITGPSAVTIVSATAVNCNATGETTTITLQFNTAILTPGAYQVAAAIGSDGNTITAGACNRQVTAGNTAGFTLAAQPPLPMATTVTPSSCIPAAVTLVFPEAIKCNSIAANGSDFIVTGPSAVTVIGAAPVNCDANGETTTVTVRFLTNILVTGAYQVQAVNGSDGNTIIGSCNRQVTIGATAGFTLAAQPPLPIGTVNNTLCAPTSVTIDFNESVDCTSLSPNGSEFTITGPSGVVVGSASGQCNINPANPKISITFTAPIAVAGTYQIHVGNGSDGNTIRGDCNRYITVGDIVSFTVPAVAPVVMDSIAPVGCAPSSLRVILDEPIRCSSVSPDGSDFIITGPSAVTIASATSCNANGLITEIVIQLTAPIVVGGTYALQLTTGNDGNTFLSECYRPAPVATLNFVTNDTVSAAFQHQITYDCETDIIDFSHDGQHHVNQWTWTVNGVVASNAQTFTQGFSASSQNQVQLVVSNGLCSDTYSESLVLNNKVTAAFTGPDMICPDDTAGFRDMSTGQIDNWQWTFGNGNTSTLETPAGQAYPATGSEKLYTVSLTISNNTGCQTTATKTIKVFGTCIIAVPTAFTPDNDGLNDYLYPLNAIKAENLDFKVFNRWGQLVFHSRDWTKKWDGRVNGIPQATNVYVWTLDYIHRDTKVRYSLKGTSTLIR